MGKSTLPVLLGFLSLTVLNAGSVRAADDTIRVAATDSEVVPFQLKQDMLRHPDFPMMRTKFGLKFEASVVQMPQVPVVIAGGDLDISDGTGISTVVNAWNKGAKNIIVFSVGAEIPIYQIIARPQFKQLADFKGSKIGSPGVQTAGAEAIEMILKRGAGLIPERDYDFVQTGSGSARAAALISGKIDALATYPPLSYDLENRGFPVVADEATYVPQYVTVVDIATRDWAEQHRDLFIRLIKGEVATGQWLKDPANKDAAIAWFAKNIMMTGSQPIGPELAARMYQFYIADKRLSFDGYAPESAIRANLAILEERGYLKEEEIPPLGQLFDFSYLNQALTELGLPTVAELPKK